MRFATLHHDPAIRSLPRWGAISLATMGVLLGLRAYREISHSPEVQYAHLRNVLGLALTLWIPVSIHALLAGITARCSRLDMTLPLPPRRLWVDHLAAVMISSSIILALCVALLSFQTSGFRGFLNDDLFLRRPTVASLLPLLITGLWLSSALLQTYRPSLRKIHFDRHYALFAATTLTGTFVLIIVLSELPSISAAIPFGLAAWIVVRTYRSLPAAFRHVPLVAATDPESSRATGAVDSTGSRSSPLLRTLWSTIWGWKGVLFLPFVAVFGALLAGLSSWFGDHTDERFANTAICWYMLLAIFPAIMKKLHTLDALPISRKMLFVCLILPGLLAVVAGYGAAELIKEFRSDTVEHIRMSNHNDHFYLTVPPENCEITGKSTIPKNTAPWGEAHEPWRAGLRRDGTIGIYSPFSTPPGSSIEFVAWQISRAVDAVYTESISPGEIESRYLEIDQHGRVVPRNGKLTILADHPDLRVRGTGRLFPFVMLIAFVPFLLLLCVYLSAYRAGVPRTRAVWIAVLLLVGTISIHIAGFVGAILKFYTLWVHTAFIKIIVRHIATVLPGGTPVTWVVCGLLVLLSYLFAQRQFERIELPPAPRQPAD
ncbi:MAG: hypothetical protein JSW50_12460 [Candidatus Latescibacterota bacterium]|nr:MAG: hypothetical protein JSW50_12460 [Candidatus Latescibacterota bacterium]